MFDPVELGNSYLIKTQCELDRQSDYHKTADASISNAC